jgi:hypothetical protein
LFFDQIVALAEKVNAEAIYFGANRTFMYNIANQPQLIKVDEKRLLVYHRLSHKDHAEVKERFKEIWTEEKFIPFCSIIFPDSEGDDNLCIKVDDVDFNKTNPGVWTMTMDHFKQSAGFTSWSEYKKDEPMEEADVKKAI